MISAHIFKANDIRGVVDETLTEEVVALIGHAYGSLAYERGISQVLVARDGRLSGQRLLTSLCEGIIKAGMDVVDLGCVPTPVLYFATKTLQTGSGIVVTGSHNPPQYNGLKFMLGGETLNGDGVTDLYRRIVGGRLHTSTSLGQVSTHNILPSYIEAMVQDVKLSRPMTIAIDCGNGAAGVVAVEIFERLGCRVLGLYCEVDGHFPHHHPDPAEAENLMDLQKLLCESDAEIGLAFDGDADRLGVVTKTGEIIYPDRQVMLFVPDILAKYPHAPIVFDAKCSAHVAPLIEGLGGQPVMWKTGHSFMKNKIKELNAPFGGEMSGHLFFNDRWHGFDDGVYSGARLLEILSRLPDEAAVTKCLNDLPQAMSTPELHIHLPEGESKLVIEALTQIGHTVFVGGKINLVDGVRVDYADGFGQARASNTTPVITLRFEADDSDAMARIQQNFRAALHQVLPDAVLPF